MVRRAEEPDLDAVREVGQRTWPATYEPVAGAEYVRSGLERWWSAEALLPSIRDGRTLVAEDGDGQVVGMASYSLDDDALVLWKLYVLPDRHGSGVGGALMDAVLEAACGPGRVRLAHLDGNSNAGAFYASRGFRVTGTERDPLGGPDNVWMELDLVPMSRVDMEG